MQKLGTCHEFCSIELCSGWTWRHASSAQKLKVVNLDSAERGEEPEGPEQHRTKRERPVEKVAIVPYFIDNRLTEQDSLIEATQVVIKPNPNQLDLVTKIQNLER